jgi:hypothetical protein
MRFVSGDDLDYEGQETSQWAAGGGGRAEGMQSCDKLASRLCLNPT